ncbi:putative ATP-dependent protease subunit C (ClpC), partial [Reticulomyxa filosa]
MFDFEDSSNDNDISSACPKYEQENSRGIRPPLTQGLRLGPSALNETKRPLISVTHVQRILATHYKEQDELSALFDDPKQAMDMFYMPVSLVSDKEYKKRQEARKEKNGVALKKSKEECMKKEDEEDIEEKTKERMNWKDIWDSKKMEYEKSEVRQIYIIGEAGTGKTTLAKKMANSWAKEELWRDHFEWLFVIDLDKLASWDMSEKTTTEIWSKVMDVIGIDEIDTSILNRLLTKEEHCRSLFILDGFETLYAHSQAAITLSDTLHNCAYVLHLNGVEHDTYTYEYIQKYFTMHRQPEKAKLLLESLQRRDINI